MSFNKESLIKLGADEKLISLIEKESLENLIPARVITQYSSVYEVAITPQKLRLSVLSGSFKKNIKERKDIPVIGDWVLLEDKNTDKLPIKSIIPRKSLISRMYKYKGNQPISANIDAVFFTFSADPLNFSIEKIRAYLNINIEGKVKRYILLNKIDLAEKEISEIISKISKDPSILVDDIIPINSIDLIGYENLKTKLLPFETSTFIGPSGVGKSTIINNLYGKKILKTSSVNKRYKGRHTTTNRKIIILPNNHIVIDTPGISFVEAQKIDIERFKKIFDYSLKCKFSDCKHISEPQCYVKKMVEIGEIAKELYNEYLELMKNL